MVPRTWRRRTAVIFMCWTLSVAAYGGQHNAPLPSFNWWPSIGGLQLVAFNWWVIGRVRIGGTGLPCWRVKMAAMYRLQPVRHEDNTMGRRYRHAVLRKRRPAHSLPRGRFG